MRTVATISVLIVLVSVYHNASGLPQTRWGGGGGGGGSGCSKWPCTGGYGGNASRSLHFLPSLSFVEFTRGSIRGRPPRARQFGVRSRVRSHDDHLACLLTSSSKFYKMAMIVRTRGDKGMPGFENAVSKGRIQKKPHLNKIDFKLFQLSTGFA